MDTGIGVEARPSARDELAMQRVVGAVMIGLDRLD